MLDIFSCNVADNNQRPDPETFPTQSVQTFLYQYWYVLWTVWHQCRLPNCLNSNGNWGDTL